MIKLAIVIGSSYALGDLVGGKLADVAKFSTGGARTGTKLATGVAAYFILSSILG